MYSVFKVPRKEEFLFGAAIANGSGATVNTKPSHVERPQGTTHVPPEPL